MTSTVSIVIPAFNSEPYIDALLGSIAGQEDAADEVVVVDDCSTDETAQRLEAWSDRLPLRIVRRASNGGVGRASTSGLEVATGEYAMIVGHDDVLLPNHVAVHRRLVRPGRLLAARVYHWRPSSGLLVPETSRIPAARRQPAAILRSHFISAFITMERRAFLELGYRSEGLEDWDLAIRAIRAGHEAVRPREFTYLYRIHSENLLRGEVKSAAAEQLLREVGRSALTPSERRALRSGFRWIEAGSMLADARRHAAAGESGAARALATGALIRGSASNRLRALPVAVAPRLENRLRMRLLSSPTGSSRD